MIKTMPSKQSGFTLIELMVVVVIVAVMLSFATFSVSTSDQAKIRKQAAAIEGALVAMCDRAAFDQRLFIAMPDETGFGFAKQVRGEWQAVDRLKDQTWLSGVQVAWQLDDAIAEQSGMPKAGWVCWPSGELTAGEIEITVDQSTLLLSWDELARFSRQNLN